MPNNPTIASISKEKKSSPFLVRVAESPKRNKSTAQAARFRSRDSKSPSQKSAQFSKIDPEVLQEHLLDFLNKIDNLVQALPEMAGSFVLDEIELKAEITAEGELSLFGSGVKVAGTGGLTFTLKRKEPK